MIEAYAGSSPVEKQRRRVVAALLAVLLAAIEISIDWSTWVELNVSIMYGLPLVLAALAGSRRLLWALMFILVGMTFAVYAAQIQAGHFTIREPLFVNRVLSALALVIITGILHVRLCAIERLAAQDEALTVTNQRLERANDELILRESQIICQNKELEVRRREAEATSERKTRFMASLSHDIRTPINAINLMAEVMCRTAENPTFAAELPDIARRLKANALSLADLLTDVLDIARFDSGRIEMNVSRISLNDLLSEHCQTMLPLAQAKGLTISLEAGASICLHIDRVKLARVVSNLLSNAIKYTDNGAVVVRAAISPDQAVLIEIQDTGAGIPAHSLDSIFDEYAQLNNPDRDPNKGWGLGLPICKRLVNLMGGAISVASEVSVGSVFTVRLGSDCIDQSTDCTLERPAISLCESGLNR
jgi:signal transduction histidine kinase